jgi:hypothetical protein
MTCVNKNTFWNQACERPFHGESLMIPSNYPLVVPDHAVGKMNTNLGPYLNLLKLFFFLKPFSATRALPWPANNY